VLHSGICAAVKGVSGATAESSTFDCSTIVFTAITALGRRQLLENEVENELAMTALGRRQLLENEVENEVENEIENSDSSAPENSSRALENSVSETARSLSAVRALTAVSKTVSTSFEYPVASASVASTAAAALTNSANTSTFKDTMKSII
jgi:hypothetical protein